MNYINAFNKSIRDLAKQSPNNETLLLINQYMRKKGRTCYYRALDELGFRVGIEFQYEQLVEDDDIVGFYATFKYHKGNTLNDQSVTKRVRHDPFNTQDECFAYLAKEYIYKLMTVPNLKDYVG